MSLNISNLSYSEQNIGLNYYKSKREYIWRFDLDGFPEEIKFLDSRLSHKKRIYKNDDIILCTKCKSVFSHDFEVEGHHCVIIQYADKYELRIDGESFTHLYNLQKNKELFEKSQTTNLQNNNKLDKVSNKTQENEKCSEMIFYKKNKTIENNEHYLFNFKIKKSKEQKSTGFKNLFKFGKHKEKYNTVNISNDSNIFKNKTEANINKNLLDFDDLDNSSNIKNTTYFDSNGYMKNDLSLGTNEKKNNQIYNFV